jgi:hypothetical protein
MWGWGVMNQVAVQEAINIRFPMENFIGNWWAGAEHDVAQAGEAAAGYRSLNMNRLGDMPVFDEIRQHVHEAGLAAGDGTNVGSVLYTRGMYAAMLAAEAIRAAQEIHGVAAITPAMMRDGMEALEMTNARMEELGMPGIGPEFAGQLRGPRRHRHGDHAAVGRHPVGDAHRLHRARRQRDPTADRRGLGPVCRREQHLQPVHRAADLTVPAAARVPPSGSCVFSER